MAVRRKTHSKNEAGKSRTRPYQGVAANQAKRFKKKRLAGSGKAAGF
jgi:hypothetical protein